MIWAVARAHRLHDAHAADVAQATWLRLLEHLTRLNDPARVGAWLATTTRRECLRLIRDDGRCVLYGNEAPEHESSDPPVPEALLISERNAALWQSFTRLSRQLYEQGTLNLMTA